MIVMAKVLILENQDTGGLYKDMLEQLMPNHFFYWCRNIADAKSHINASYSAVIFDQRLDNSELGTDFMLWCKNEFPHITGIMLSTHVTPEQLQIAIDRKLMVKFLTKTSNDIAQLPYWISAAIDKSEYLQAVCDSDNTSVYIGTIRVPGILGFFHRMSVHKIKDVVINKEYVDETKWDVIVTAHAGQSTILKETYQLEHTYQIRCDATISTEVQHQQVIDLIGKNLGSKLGWNLNANAEVSVKETIARETSETNTMPPLSSKPDEICLSSWQLQANQVYEIHSVALRVECPVCKHDQYLNYVVEVPTSQIKQRKKMVFSNNDVKYLDV